MAKHANITSKITSQRYKPILKPKRPRRLNDDYAAGWAAMRDEARALREIAENGDLIIIGGQSWLLVQAPKSLIDILAAIDGNTDDLEPDVDGEPDDDDEPNPDDEQECEDEGAQCDDEGAIETDGGASEDEGCTFGYIPYANGGAGGKMSGAMLRDYRNVVIGGGGIGIDPDGRRVRLTLIGGSQ